MSQIQIPKGWEIVKLSNSEYFIDVIGGGTPSRDNSSYYGGIIPWVRLADMKTKYIYETNETLTDLGLKKLGDKIIPKNAVILSTRATIGEVAIAGRDLCTNQGFKSVICNFEKVIPEYLYYFFKSIKKLLLTSSKSATYSEINKSRLLNIDIILPPLETQKKIVEKLDYIFGEFEEKKRQIIFRMSEFNSEKIHKTYLNYLLKLAFSGVLTGEKRKNTSEPNFMCPEGWELKKLSEVCVKIKAGFAEGKKNTPDGIIHLRMNNISTNFRLNFDLIRTIEPNEEQIKNYRIKKNDIVFNNTNSVALLGKSAIFSDNRLCLYSNHITLLRVNEKVLIPKWVLLFLQYLWYNRYFEKNSMKWINQASFNNEKIKNLEILIPSLEIQKKLIDMLDEKFKEWETYRTKIENIEKQYQNIKKSIQSLSNSILNCAFTGRLVN